MRSFLEESIFKTRESFVHHQRSPPQVSIMEMSTQTLSTTSVYYGDVNTNALHHKRLLWRCQHKRSPPQVSIWRCQHKRSPPQASIMEMSTQTLSTTSVYYGDVNTNALHHKRLLWRCQHKRSPPQVSIWRCQHKRSPPQASIMEMSTQTLSTTSVYYGDVNTNALHHKCLYGDVNTNALHHKRLLWRCQHISPHRSNNPLELVSVQKSFLLGQDHPQPKGVARRCQNFYASKEFMTKNL